MMKLPVLQRELETRSITLSVRDGKLQCHAPAGTMTPGLTQAVKEHRDTLIELLTIYASQDDTPVISEQIEQDTITYTVVYGLLTDLQNNGQRLVFLEDGTRDIVPMPGWPRLERKARAQFVAGMRAINPTLLKEAYDFLIYEDVPAPESEHQAATHGGDHQHQVPDGGGDPVHQDGKKTRKRKDKAIVYADISGGHAVLSTGETLTFTAWCSLSELLTRILEVSTCDRLYICGELPADYRLWLMDSRMWEEYTTGKRGIYLDTKSESGHVVRYRHRAAGYEIEIRTADSWFGDAEYTVEQAYAAMRLLNQYLQGTFTEDTIAYATPALTFQQIWQRENRLTGKKFDLLPENIRTLIHSSTGQGRIELCTQDDIRKLPGLYYYDGIFYYAALTWGMGTELDRHDFENVYAGKVPARYRIKYTVPGDWHHIGLFMTPKEQVTGDMRDDNAWYYPGEKEQGRTFECWCDGAELDVAYNLPDGTKWDITILERIIFKPEKESTVKKPLDTITNKLTRLREKLEQDAKIDTARTDIYSLVRGMVRNILLHGIGSFHRKDRDTTYILPANEAPDEYTSVRPFIGDLFIYTVSQKVEAYTQQFEHPEWPQLVWGRCRARMTKAALSLPRETIVAIRTDAIAVSTEQPQWNENTKVGTLRQKWAIRKQLEAPHDFDSLDKLVHRYVKGDR